MLDAIKTIKRNNNMKLRDDLTHQLRGEWGMSGNMFMYVCPTHIK